MDVYMTSQSIINNEYDYSNSLPTIEAVTYLVQYCDQMNKQLKKFTEEDEAKNKQFKPEYKEYTYKKSYSQQFEVFIREKGYDYINCKDYETFLSAVKDNNLNQVTGLDIELCMNFKRGKGDKLEEHENTFKIRFRPYEIKFVRKSNHNDPVMNSIEDQINEILKKFPIANCIFCNKKN